jgi:NIMA-interacting peptidyl-prolyl cis-trans isomerase 4
MLAFNNLKMPKGKKGAARNRGAAAEEEKKGGAAGKVKTVKQVKARHILCEKHGKCMEAYNKLTEEHGNRPPAGLFGQLAEEYSECSSSKRGGDLGWFGRGKMLGAFQDVAFATDQGCISEPFRTREGYHIVFVEGRRN